jgi:hypothetical protein
MGINVCIFMHRLLLNSSYIPQVNEVYENFEEMKSGDAYS